MQKEDLIKQIQELLNSTGGSSHINPEYLEYLTQEDLENMYKSLINQQRKFQEDTNAWFDELFGKADDYK